jgi:hypothetical protein
MSVLKNKKMKIKKLKKIIIGDTPFNIKWDKKRSGGSFDYPYKKEKGGIEIGTSEEKVNPVRVLSILIHELKEIIQVEQCVRYDRGDENKNYEFNYTHKEHTDLCSRLAGLLSQFLQ